MNRRLLIVAIAFSVVATGAAHATVIVVDVGDTGDYTTIQPALTAASEGDTVLVMPGTYTGTNNTDLDFAGTNVKLRSTHGAAQTTIDCENARSVRAFMFLSGDAGPSCVIEGFTLTRGNRFSGGLVYCWLSSPTFIDCVFSNSYGNYGGALYICESTASFSGCQFIGNTSEHGGGAQVELASPTFTNCSFSGNTSNGEGGGVDVLWDAAPTFTNCLFYDNHAASDGGGMRCYDNSSPTITACDFIENDATGHGGGVFCDGTSAPTISTCTFQLNTATVGGGLACESNSSPSVSGTAFIGNDRGAVYTDFASPTFSLCTFMDNTGQFGAGAYCYESSSSFDTCLFSGNYASGVNSEGGALVCDNADIEVTNCTFSDNGADEGGGSVHCWNSDPVFTNCIIAYSTSGPALACEVGTESPLLLCCDLYGNAGGDWVGCIADQATTGGNVSAEPKFCNRPGGDFTIDASSACAAAHSGSCGLIGALDVSCDTPVQARSWGAIKSMYR